MADGMYNRFKANLMNKEVDLGDGGDTIKVMLLDDSHSFEPTDNVIGDVNANEIVGAGYTAGGATLAGQSVTQDDVNDLAKWDGTDVEWAAATFSTWHGVLYDDTVATDDLILSMDWGGEKVVTAGVFKIQWHVNGIIILATAA